MKIAALIISMLVLCFAVLSFLHNDYTHINHDTKSYVEHSEDALPDTCVIQGKAHPISSKECAEQARYRESHNLKKNDFIAQKSMAFYALLGLIVGSVGLCIIGLTLNETRKASIAANKTLDAAQRALAAERAYLLFQEHKFRFIEGRLSDGHHVYPRGIDVTLGFSNDGRSPATNVKLTFLQTCDSGEPQVLTDEFFIQVVKKEDAVAQGTGMTAWTISQPIVGPLLDEWISGERRWFAYGRAEYDTLYTKTRQKTFVLVELIAIVDSLNALWAGKANAIDIRVRQHIIAGESNK